MRRISHAFPYPVAPRPVQLERWTMSDDPDGLRAEISVIFYPDHPKFEIAYFEGREIRIHEGFLFGLDDTVKKLEEVRRKVDPDAFDKAQARFVRRVPRTREDLVRLEKTGRTPTGRTPTLPEIQNLPGLERIEDHIDRIQSVVDSDKFLRRHPGCTFDPCPSCGGGDLMSKCEVCHGSGFVRASGPVVDDDSLHCGG